MRPPINCCMMPAEALTSAVPHALSLIQISGCGVRLMYKMCRERLLPLFKGEIERGWLLPVGIFG